jgi:hypothetical protein
MTIRAMIIVCGMTLLAGCGFADKNSRMPAFLRQPSDVPSQPDPEPDLKEMVRVNALFTTRPTAVAVSRPRRRAEHRFDACVKAVMPSVVDDRILAVTTLVIIDHGKMIDRRRATSDDQCGAETYEKVDLEQP